MSTHNGDDFSRPDPSGFIGPSDGGIGWYCPGGKWGVLKGENQDAPLEIYAPAERFEEREPDEPTVIEGK